MAKSNSPPTGYAQLYIYERKSLFSVYEKVVAALFVGEWLFTLAVVSPAGLKQVKGCKSVEKLTSALTQALRGRINRFEIVGKSERSSIPVIRVACEVSPLNADWAPIGEIDPGQYNRQELRMLRSFQSRESFVRLNRLKRHYVFLSIEAAHAEGTGALTSKRLVKDFENVIGAVSGDRSRDYIGSSWSSLFGHADRVVG